MATILGRDTELAALRSALARAGRPLDVVIRGEAGIGKTTVWQAAVGELRAEGRTVLVTRPTEAESALPYAALVDLLDAVVGEEELALLPPPQRTAVEVVLLRRAAEPIADLAVSTAVLRMLEHLARRGGLVLALDDAHWVDAASARTLAFVLRRLDGADVVVLSTVRAPHTSTVGHDHGGELVEVPVDGLDLDGLGQVVEDHLDRRLLLPALVQLRRLSEGHPMAALELVRAADARGLDLAGGSAVPVPERLEVLLRERLVALPDDVRQVLLVAACAAAPDVPLLERVLAPASDLPRLLREAERAGVLRLEGDAVRFTHPLLLYVVMDASPLAERRAAHAALAAVVADEVDRGRHLAAATVDPDAAVAQDIEDAARRATERAAPASAALLLEEALRVTPPELTAALASRAEEAVLCWLAAGDSHRGTAVGRSIVERLPPSATRGRLLAALADAVASSDGILAAFPVWEQAVDEVRGDDAATAEVLRGLAWERTVAGELHAGLRLVEEALAAAERFGDPETLGATLGMVAMLQFLRGDPAAEATLARAAAALPDPGSSPAGRELERRRTMMAVWSDRSDAADLVASRRDTAQGRGDVQEVAFWNWFEILLTIRDGDLDAALERVRASEREQAFLPRDAHASSELWLRSLAEYQAGHVEDARRHAELGVAAARQEGGIAFELWCEGVLGSLDLSLGRSGEAAERLWRLDRRCEELGFDEPGHLRHLADGVEALLLAGRPAEAQHLADRLASIAARTGDRWALGASLRCAAMVCEQHDRERALELLAGARGHHEELGQPFDLARTLLVLGATARRAKRKAEARAALEQAVRLLSAMPAPLWLARAEDELARVIGRGGSRWELTPTEQRIADLVARGRTNREVADELFLSAKTVEWNLSKVYRKVGVRSRSELASSWGRGPATAGRSGGSPGSGEAGAP